MRRLPATTGLAVIVGAATVQAQTLRGEVRAAETAVRLPYSTVLLEPGFPPRFTDDSGFFRYDALAAGSYRLTARAIGYSPFDTTITVAGEPIVLLVTLRPLAFELPPVIVAALGPCRRPGPPSPEDEPELAAIFDQLRETAARFQLLSDGYPFRYWLERRMWDERPGRGESPAAVDTAEYRSNVRRQYRPGNLIEREPKVRGGRVLRLPTLVDLADSTFHRAHCFGLAGVDSLDGRTQWRVDFAPAERLRSPDVGGTAWLDTDTYQLWRLTLRLTRPERALSTIRSLEATVTFDYLLPAVTVPALIASTTQAGRGRRQVTIHEEQRLIGLHFVGARPGAATPESP